MTQEMREPGFMQNGPQRDVRRSVLNRDPVARLLAYTLALPGLVLLLPGNQIPELCAAHCERYYAAALLFCAAVMAFGDRFAESVPQAIPTEES